MESRLLGFGIAPSLEFILPTEMNVAIQEEPSEEQHPPVEGGFLPLAYTCSNGLEVPRPTDKIPLPPQDKLFVLYDLAFSQGFFGKK